jgi:catechol 2,3-dioxygenase-like lactoylglutathione lyase family enzyme
MKSIKLLSAIITLLAIHLSVFSQEKKNEFASDIIKIGIVASDLQSTLNFYTNILGLSKVREFDIDSATSATFGFTTGVPFHVTGLKTNNSEHSTELKILSFGPNNAFKKPHHLNDNLGMQYMTIYMNTMAPVIERLKKNNIKFLGKTPTQTEGYTLVLVQDPDGVFVELIGKE